MEILSVVGLWQVANTEPSRSFAIVGKALSTRDGSNVVEQGQKAAPRKTVCVGPGGRGYYLQLRGEERRRLKRKDGTQGSRRGSFESSKQPLGHLRK